MCALHAVNLSVKDEDYYRLSLMSVKQIYANSKEDWPLQEWQSLEEGTKHIVKLVREFAGVFLQIRETAK